MAVLYRLLSAVALVGLVLAAGCGSPTSSAPPAAGTPPIVAAPPAPPPLPPPATETALPAFRFPEMRLAAADLGKDFAADTKAASDKYTGKFLEVRGKVAKAGDKNAAGPVVVSLQAQDGKTVRCALPPSQQQEAAGLAIDQQVTVRGVCAGPAAGDAAVLDLTDATLVDVTGALPPE